MDDLISRQAAIDATNKAFDRETLLNRFVRKVAIDAIKQLPSAQPEPSEAARDIATIIENEKDMRVIQERNLMYQRGYEDGFREGRTRAELLNRLEDDLK